MGHITSKSYIKLQQRLDKMPQGAPESETLYKILKILFSENEAELISVLPINFFTLAKASEIWKQPKEECQKILDELADKGIIVDFGKKYIVAPAMAGFFEFTLMRTGGKFDQKILSELYYQYINKEDKFVARVFGLDPPIARTFIHEDTVPKKDRDIILDYEKASKVIEKASAICVGQCYCRHKMHHAGKACNAPMEVCLTFGDLATGLVKHGFARKISKQEAREILDKCIKHGLVQIGSNMQEDVSWMCNCCGCCCEALLAYKELGYNPRIETSWYAINNDHKCTGCGVCVKRCPVNAITLVKEGILEPKTFAKVDMKKCIGCGVCTRFCPPKSLEMVHRKEKAYVPVDTFERSIIQAIDGGTLQNLLLDTHHLWTHEVVRQFLKIIFKLPPTKWLLLNKQIRSVYLNKIGAYLYKDNKEAFCHKKPDYSHPELKKKY